jgi:hypothetical protein
VPDHSHSEIISSQNSDHRDDTWHACIRARPSCCLWLSLLHWVVTLIPILYRKNPLAHFIFGYNNHTNNRGETVHLCATVKSNIKKSKRMSAQFNTK